MNRVQDETTNMAARSARMAPEGRFAAAALFTLALHSTQVISHRLNFHTPCTDLRERAARQRSRESNLDT